MAVLSNMLGLVYGLSWGPYVNGDRIKQRYRIQHYSDFDYETPTCAFLEANKKSVFKNHTKDDSFLHVYELDKFKDTSPAFVYGDVSGSEYTMINPVEEIQSIGILAHVNSMETQDSLIVLIHKMGKDQAAIRQAIGSREILSDGRAYFTVEDSELAQGDTLVIRLAVTGKSIKLPLYKPYPGSPMLVSDQLERDDERSISIELNPPKRLYGYYRQLALRNRLKLFKNKLS